MCQIEKTISYYNQNAKTFAEGTLSLDFKSKQDLFAGKLQEGARILDFGCGAGRDTKYFMEKGFQVDALDGSEELCRIASEFTGNPVKHAMFQDLDETERYDGIWACSSILHVSKAELPCILGKMAKAAKPCGILYVSFKYGDYEGERNGRYFTDMTEDTFAPLLQGIGNLSIEEQWVTKDVRPERGNEKWLNLILRKK